MAYLGQRPQKGQASGRLVDLDRAAQPTAQAEANGAERGGQRGGAAAGHGRDVRRAKPAVRGLRGRVHEQHVDGGGAGPAEGGPQEDLLLPGAAHPQAQRA